MVRVREGNSFEVLYTASLEGGDVVDLRTVENLRVKLLNSYYGNIYDVQYSFMDESITIDIPHTIAVGLYRITVEFIYSNEYFFRDPKAFYIVPNVEAETGDSECENIQVNNIEIDDTVNGLGLPGRDGKSAYEVWLDDGHTGTADDFLNWLKLKFEDLTPEDIVVLQEPATVAAEDVEERMQIIEDEFELMKNNWINNW